MLPQPADSLSSTASGVHSVDKKLWAPPHTNKDTEAAAAAETHAEAAAETHAAAAAEETAAASTVSKTVLRNMRASAGAPAAAPPPSAAAAAALAAASTSPVEEASLRRIGCFLSLIEQQQQQQQQGAILLPIEGAASGDFCSRAQQQQQQQQQQILPALRQLLLDLKGICDSARPSSSSSSAAAVGAARAAAVAAGGLPVESVVDEVLSATEPMSPQDHRNLLRAVVRGEAPWISPRGVQQPFAAAAAAAAAEGASVSSTVSQPPTPASAAAAAAAASPYVHPAAGVAAAAGGSVSCTPQGASGEAATVAAPLSLQLLRAEAAAAAKEALETPRLLAMEGGSLRAAEAVRLCGQAGASCSARYIPKYRGDAHARTRSGAAAAAAAAATAATPGSRHYTAWLEGAYMPEFDDTDQYTEETDVGYSAMEMTQRQFLAAFCGGPHASTEGGPSWGPQGSEGVHPLHALGIEPAVDVKAARLEMAAAVAVAAAAAAAVEGEEEGAPRAEAFQQAPQGSVSPAAATHGSNPIFKLKQDSSKSSGGSGAGGSRLEGRSSSPSFGGEAPEQQRHLSKAQEHQQQQQRQELPGEADSLLGSKANLQTDTSNSTEPAPAATAAAAGTAAVARAVSSEDELAGCGVQEQVLTSAETAQLLHEQQQQQRQQQEQQQQAYAAARNWEETYCGGDKCLFRKRQLALATAALSRVCYPPSPDPAFPRRCGAQGAACREASVSSAVSSGVSSVSCPERSAVFDCFSLKVVFKRNTTGCEPHRELVLPPGTLLGGRYKVQHEVGAAAFSRCLQGVDVCTGERVCLKVMKNEKEYLDQSLDEVAVLRLLQANGDPDEFRFLRLRDCLYFRGHLVLVTELLDEDLYTFSTAIKRQRQPSFWSLGRLQIVARDVLLALKFTHDLHIIHGDLKPENILACFTEPLAAFQHQRAQEERQRMRQQHAEQQHWANSSSSGDGAAAGASAAAAGFDERALDLFRVKVIDYGNCCFTSDELVVYTQSRCYRAPEVLLELPYCQKIDIWSLGCILYELWTGEMMLGCHSVPALLAKMVGIVGPLPNYMARNSPIKHQLLDVDGYLYQFIDSITQAQEQRQQQQQQGVQQPSFSVAFRPPEDTLINAVRDHLKQRQGGSRTDRCNNRLIRFFIPKPTSLRQRLRCHDPVFVDFLSQMLRVDPCQRWAAAQLLKHPFLLPGRYVDGLKPI